MKELEALLIQASHLEYKYAWTESRGDRDLISWHQIETEEKIKYCLTKLVAELLELKDHDLRHCHRYWRTSQPLYKGNL